MVVARHRSSQMVSIVQSILDRRCYHAVTAEIPRSCRTFSSEAPGPGESAEAVHLKGTSCGSSVIISRRQKLVKEIVRRSREEKPANDERNDSLYQLGEQYLDMEHESRAWDPSKELLVHRKISEILEKRFNYNPVYSNGGKEYRGHDAIYRDTTRATMECDAKNGSCEDDANIYHGTSAREKETQDNDSITDEGNAKSMDVIRQLVKGILPNGSVVRVDMSELRNHKTEPGHQSVFDVIDSLLYDEELMQLWTKGPLLDVVHYNRALLPLVASDPVTEYKSMRNKTVLFNRSYALVLEVSSGDADLFLEHFVTCSLGKMKNNRLQYTCVVDSKGYLMDTAYVAKMNDRLFLITNGLHKRALYDYMTAYQVTCRESRIEATVKPLLSHRIISLQGPRSVEVLCDLVRTEPGDPGDLDTNSTVTGKLGNKPGCSIRMDNELPPFMGTFSATLRYTDLDDHQETGVVEEKICCMRISDVGEDGLEFIVTERAAPHLARLLLQSSAVSPAGFQTYDTGRMEAGILRPDVDLPSEPSPIQASVAWSVDTQKLRFGSLFGKQHIVSQLMHGVAKVRLGLITNRMVDTDCKVLNSDTRMPIGFVTSCVWSPGLQMYLSQVYINRQYARHDMPVYLSVPLRPTAPTTKREYRKYYRNLTKRELLRGTVVRLPFVFHNYPIEKSQSSHVGGRNVLLQGGKFNADRDSVNGTTQGAPNDERNDETISEVESQSTNEASADGSHSERVKYKNGKKVIKTRKQLWREVVARQRKLNSKTLERALEDLEQGSTGPSKPQGVHPVTEVETELLSYDRINLQPRADVPPEKILEYYRQLHDVPVIPRHRRYRPPVGNNAA